MAAKMMIDCQEMTNSSKVVEESLVPLLQHLRLQLSVIEEGSEYMGAARVKLPRWKAYEKMEHSMQSADRRRLDNIIWRAWYLHYMFGKRTQYIEFAEEVPGKEATSMTYPILEGKQDQQGILKVKSGYQSWRQFWKDRLSQSPNQRSPYLHHADSASLGPSSLGGCQVDQSACHHHMAVAQDLSKLSEWMEAIPDTLFTSLPPPQKEDMMDIDMVTFKEYVQPKNVGNLLRSDPAGSYMDFLSTQLINQQLFPGLAMTPMAVRDQTDAVWGADMGGRRNQQIERPRRSVGPEARSAPYGQPRAKTEHQSRDSSEFSQLDAMDNVAVTPESLTTPEPPMQWPYAWAGLGGGEAAHVGTAESSVVQGQVAQAHSPYNSQNKSRGSRVMWTLGADSSEEEEANDAAEGSRLSATEAKRTAHILAEQKRRNNIRLGFSELQRAIPSLHGATYGHKMSKAMVLQLTMEHIQTLEWQRAQLVDETARLRDLVNLLQLGLSQAQGLPTNAPMTVEIATAKRMYTEHVESFSNNPKAKLFHMMFEPLLDRFMQTVLVDRPESMGVSFSTWYLHHCTHDRLKVCAAIALHRLSQPQMPSSDVGTNPHDLATVAAMATFAKAKQQPNAPIAGQSAHTLKVHGIQSQPYPTASPPATGLGIGQSSVGYSAMPMAMGGMSGPGVHYPVQQPAVFRGKSCPNMSIHLQSLLGDNNLSDSQ